MSTFVKDVAGEGKDDGRFRGGGWRKKEWKMEMFGGRESRRRVLMEIDTWFTEYDHLLHISLN